MFLMRWPSFCCPRFAKGSAIDLGDVLRFEWNGMHVLPTKKSALWLCYCRVLDLVTVRFNRWVTVWFARRLFGLAIGSSHHVN